MRLLRPLVGLLRVDRRRVEAEHDHLDALQAHDAIGLGPAPVVADAHAEDAAHGAPDRKAEIARLEIALLQMLVGALRVELGVAGQMHLAVLADDRAGSVDQDRGVEVMAVGRQLGIAEASCPCRVAAARSNSGRVAAFGISRSNQMSASARFS